MSGLKRGAYGCALLFLVTWMFGAQVGAQQQSGGIVITPIRLFLAGNAPSGDLTIKNTTSDLAQFQVQGYAWKESTEGKTELTSSDDLIFYPTIFSLAPGATQLIRIGIEGNPPTVERTFRLLLTHLPPPQLPGEIAKPSIPVSEQFSIPVFLQPDSPTSQIDLSRAEIGAQKLSLYFRNTGNSYDMVHGIKVTGLGASGATVFNVKGTGWYVLAGSDRIFTLQIPKGACASVRSVKIDAALEDGHADATLPVTGECR
jgi:fimbrial chaperone protein